jgi:hypothetical protein
VAAGLLVAALALGVFVALTPRTAKSETVLVADRPIAAGSQITAADLSTVTVTARNGLAVIPAGQEPQILGRPAALALVAGQPLAPADVGAPAAAAEEVGLALSAGEYPPNLAVGEAVQVVIGQPGQAGPVLGSTGRSIGAVVVTVSQSASKPDGALVTVAVAPGDAQTVAAGAAEGAAVVIGT